jgi:hypothetical protein
MSPRSSRRARKSRAAGFISCCVLALATALTPTTPALAASGPYLIDGVVPDPGTINLQDPHGSVKELGPINSSATKIGVIHNAATPMLGMTNPNAQVDLSQAWLKLQRQSGKDWLYFAWERDNNTGSGFIAYEFMAHPVPAACDYSRPAADLVASCNPWKNRAAGDFMILWDQQGGSTTLYKRVWSGSGSNLTLGPPVALSSAVSEARFSPDGFRGEAALNLTDAIFGGTAGCVTIANVIPSTVTGNSDTADYKDTVLQNIPPLTNCSASVSTTPSDSTGTALPGATVGIGTGVVGVTDQATIDLTGGTATPTGSIDFYLCKVDSPGTCDTGGTSVGSTSIAGGSYPKTVTSPTAYVTSVGRYCWRGVWAGDAANSIGGTSDSSAGECFTVTAASPGLSTDAGDGVVLGNAVSDSATLSGAATDPASPVINLTGAAGPAAGGTITFKLYGPSNTGCGSLVATTAAVPVTGNGDYATPDPQVVPTEAGDYHWVATYSGSTNNNGTTHNSTCTDTGEDVTVTSVAVSLDTAQSWVPNDSASLSAPAGGDLSGNVTFTLFGSTDCSGAALDHWTVPVSGSSPQTVSTTNTTAYPAGDYSWQVTYDSSNAAQRDIPLNNPTTCQETSSLTVTDGSTVTSP